MNDVVATINNENEREDECVEEGGVSAGTF